MEMDVTTSRKDYLNSEIGKLRNKLYELKKLGLPFTNPKFINVSTSLDQKLIEYQKLCSK